MPSWSKTAEHSAWCAHKSPIMKWANVFKVCLKTNSLKLNVASYNEAHWYTDTDGFFEHSPTWGSLFYKGACPLDDNLRVFGPPLYNYQFTGNTKVELHVINNPVSLISKLQ